MSATFVSSLLAASIAAVLPAVAQAGPDHWVRVEADAAGLRSVLGADVRAVDYGRFQWLAVDAAQLARLKAERTLRIVEVAAPFELDLGGVRFDPVMGVPDFGAWSARSATAPAERDFRLVQFDGPVREADLQTLRMSGLAPVQYLHPFTYVVWGSRNDLDRIRSRSAVRWTGDFAPAYRVLPQWRALDAAEREVHVLVYRDAPGIEAAVAAIGAADGGLRPIDRHLAVINLRVGGDRFADLASVPGVYSVQPVPTDGGLRGEMSNQVNAGNIDGSNLAFPGYLAWLGGIGLDGTGVILADVDGGIYDTNADLVNRMLPCTGDTCGGSAVDDHGTHTAAIMAGDGSSGVSAGGFLRGLGMAPGANLIEQKYEPTYLQAGGMLKLMTESQRNGAYASGNSWGPSGSPLGYDGDTRQVDVGVRDADPDAPGDQPLLYVLSAMNGGGGTTSLGTPDEGKNMFTIGSTKMQGSSTVQYTEIDDISSNSSHGPARDGRAVPAMVAPGCSVDSATGTSSYGLMCGTSMASPHVTGASALFVEYYRNLHDGADPSPALVKAAFTAVAKNLVGHDDADGNTITHLFDSKQGWGRMQVAPVLAPAQQVAYIDQSVVFDNTGESWTQTFAADDPAQPMRIMLAWTDAPGHGLGGSTPAWNNDLDLRVTAASGTYLGNVLDNAGWSVVGGSADEKNNTEAVFLQSSRHGGAITVEVLAADINSDGLPNDGDGTDQDFALVCYNCVARASEVDLSISASAATPHAQAGQPVGYDVEITNAGDTDASDVRLIVVGSDLADGAISTGWTCGPAFTLLNCVHDDPLPAGASVMFAVTATVRPDPADPVVANFSVSAAEPDAAAGDNTAVVSIPLLDLIFADGFEAADAP